MALSPGTRLGPYEIVALLGAGGMGEVYRGKDTRLERMVAIKVLPARLTANAESLERFRREARAVSALNHPNICALYDVGEEAGQPFLVLELVEGRNLHDRLLSGPLPMAELLEIGIQISGALDAAHRSGIVHRDLKPANLVQVDRGSGQAVAVKVLDFGIAKYINATCPSDAQSTFSMLTVAGGFAGTPTYASPEQIRGEEVDGRSDLFAFGLVLYQMATGSLPYPGASLGQMWAAGTEGTVRRPSEIRNNLPSGIDSLILKLLRKDPAQRFQSAAEVRTALARLQSSGGLRVKWILKAAVAAGTLLGGVGLWFAAQRLKPPATVEYVRLTNFPDAVHSPVLSKDGKMVAFVRGPIGFLVGGGELYLKFLPDGEPVALTHDNQVKMAPVFGPDGSRIVYTNSFNDTFSIPLTGGQPSPLMSNAACLRWVGAGRVLFSEITSGFHMGLTTAAESRSEPRKIYFPESRQGMVHFSEPSPDRKWILAVEMLNAVWQRCRLVPFDGSSMGRQVGPEQGLCTAASWSPDGRWMYFTVEIDSESHLWRQRFPNGEAEQITFGPNQQWGATAEADGRSLITAAGNTQSTVWYHDENGDRPLSGEGYSYRPLVTPDGGRVFYLVRRGARGANWTGELWATDLGTGRNERVLPDFLVQNYHVSQDGKTVLVDRFDESGYSSIWMAAIDRSQPPRRLSPEGNAQEQRPFFGASGDIYFARQEPEGRILYRMRADGSARQRLSAEPDTYLVNVSPDEKWAVVWESGDTSLLPLSGGPMRRLCACSVGPIFQDSPRVSWSGDGKWLLVNAGGAMTGLGTTVVPWHGVDALPSGTMSPADLRRLPGAQQILQTSVSAGATFGRYAFVRQAEQSNLYRIRIP
jgi:serine/threonine protein kinase/Tol biopolymer transport system component